MLQDVPDMSSSGCSQSNSAEGRIGTVQMPCGVLDGGAHWRHLANTI